MLIVISHLSYSEDDFSFDDRGASYNPMTYVQTIETGNGAYTIEFKNEEESYYTNFIVTSKGVVAFDPLSDSAAQEYSRIIKKYSPGKPLLAIIYSHLHTDHIAGARILRKNFGSDVPIIAHERTLKYFKHRNVPFIDLPTETVTDKGKIYKFGDRTVDLRYLGDAHTASILVPIFPELELVYVCDYASNDVVGWTDLPGIDIDEMMTMQRRTLELEVAMVTFCHGPPDTIEAVKRQLDYYESVLFESRKALEKGLTEDQAADLIDLPEYKHFRNYNDWFKENVRAMYRWADLKSRKR
ncbi:MBL fold metallo-hydrolase [Cognaticolwellia mytili]|uniref:MBL fold metallo-hydrolase n=1 Tax=Cognaticolwellia mytili TaxID=1888913 RepID=UPI001301D5F0|nr:MBL fold metallo-hydrolase [Cognaticolwellia mytili]